MAKEAGYIRHMLVDIGDRVQQGQLLATLEIPELQADLVKARSDVETASAERAVARGDLQRAQAGAQIAQLSYNRIQDVSKKEPGLVPLQEVDVAHSHNLEADAQVSAALQRVQAAESRYQSAVAGLAHETALVEYTRIVAPFRGVVTQRYASEGSMIQAGIASQTQAMPVVKVSQNDLLRLMLPVPEENVASIHNGQHVSVVVPALNRTFDGTVTRFADRLQMSTQNHDRGGRRQKSATDIDSRDVCPGDTGNGGGQKRKCRSARRRGRHRRQPEAFRRRPQRRRASAQGTSPAFSRPSISRSSPERMRATSSSPAAIPVFMMGKRFSPVCSPPEWKGARCPALPSALRI